MDTRKKCAACGLIAFASEDVCKRCGSDKLFDYAMPEDLPLETKTNSKNEMHFLNYVACFMLACIVECAAIFPILQYVGLSASGAATSYEEQLSVVIVFVLHLPTSFFVYLLFGTDFGFFLLLITPFIQIIFWTFMFTKLWRWTNGLNKLK